ncbi:hypothetical protein D3C73_905250 [compost metagenome]
MLEALCQPFHQHRGRLAQQHRLVLFQIQQQQWLCALAQQRLPLPQWQALAQ